MAIRDHPGPCARRLLPFYLLPSVPAQDPRCNRLPAAPHCFFLPGCLFAFVLKPTASCVSFLLGLSIIFRKPSLERWMLRKGPPWLCSHRAYADLWVYPQSWTIRSQVTSPHKILSAWRHRLHPMHSCISKGPTEKVPK